jgi:hypothetical protein
MCSDFKVIQVVGSSRYIYPFLELLHVVELRYYHIAIKNASIKFAYSLRLRNVSHSRFFSSISYVGYLPVALRPGP